MKHGYLIKGWGDTNEKLVVGSPGCNFWFIECWRNFSCKFTSSWSRYYSASAPSPIPFQVQISGAVQHPGVYELPPGSRLQDAIDLAGGFTIDANKLTLNLAAHLENGVRVDVPYQNSDSLQTTKEQDPPKDEAVRSLATSSPSESHTDLININTAD